MNEAKRVKAKSVLQLKEKVKLESDAAEKLAAASARLNWLRFAATKRSPKRRTELANKPVWSFAGDLKKVAREIEKSVSTTVPQGRGNKDDLPLVYVSNPPRHGKSLLLDQLFTDEAESGVAVLNVTYNAATQISELLDLSASALDAVRGLLLRILNDLVFDVPDWRWLAKGSPLLDNDLVVQMRARRPAPFTAALALWQGRRRASSVGWDRIFRSTPAACDALRLSGYTLRPPPASPAAHVSRALRLLGRYSATCWASTAWRCRC
jgi:hypothetical protein